MYPEYSEWPHGRAHPCRGSIVPSRKGILRKRMTPISVKGKRLRDYITSDGPTPDSTTYDGREALLTEGEDRLILTHIFSRKGGSRGWWKGLGSDLPYSRKG